MMTETKKTLSALVVGGFVTASMLIPAASAHIAALATG